MADWLGWIVAGALTAILGVLAWFARAVISLPTEYMPRDQINKRFDDLRQYLHDELKSSETHSQDRFAQQDKRFDALEAKSDRIIEMLGGKADR